LDQSWLATTRPHEVYSQLIKLVRHAEGAIGQWQGVRFKTDLKTLSTEQLAQLLKEARPGGEDEKEILAILEQNKEMGIKRVEQVLHRRDLEEARRKHLDATNHLILEGIFVTRRVRELAGEALRELWSAWVNVDMDTRAPGSGNWMLQYDAELAAASKKIGELEDAMRADLLPELVGPVPPATTA
jgi:hypothetical protein